MISEDRPLTTYRVRVGHWEIHLKARDTDEAIQMARRYLGQEMPRLYDVIRSLATRRFEVEAAA